MTICLWLMFCIHFQLMHLWVSKCTAARMEEQLNLQVVSAIRPSTVAWVLLFCSAPTYPEHTHTSARCLPVYCDKTLRLCSATEVIKCFKNIFLGPSKSKEEKFPTHEIFVFQSQWHVCVESSKKMNLAAWNCVWFGYYMAKENR